MIDVIPELIDLFAKNDIILINESVSDSINTYPLVTYRERNNMDVAFGNNIGYSTISFIFNFWGRNIAEISALAAKADMILKSVDFTRNYFEEQNIGGLYRKIATYSRLVREVYK